MEHAISVVGHAMKQDSAVKQYWEKIKDHLNHDFGPKLIVEKPEIN